MFFHVPKSRCFCWMLQPCFLDSFVFCAAFLWTFILAFRESSSSSNRWSATTCRLLQLGGAPTFICVVLAASFNPGIALRRWFEERSDSTAAAIKWVLKDGIGYISVKSFCPNMDDILMFILKSWRLGRDIRPTLQITLVYGRRRRRMTQPVTLWLGD